MSDQNTAELRKIRILLSQLIKLFEKNESKKWLTVKDAARLCNRSQSSIRRWIQEGKLKAVKLHEGKEKDRYHISQKDIEEMFRQAQF